jgi:hypothetical protein
MLNTTVVAVPHMIKGDVVFGEDVRWDAADGAPFSTPALDLNALVWTRTQPLPASQVPVAEIIELLVATGAHMRDDPEGYLAESLEHLVRTSPYERRILESSYAELGSIFTAERLWTLVNNELGGPAAVDSWRPLEGSEGRRGYVRAVPTRVLHVLAGNGPGVAAKTIAWAALTKGAHLLKMPSNDLFSASAILRSMAAVAPDHPSVRSFSAVYWRGGDASVENVLIRPQFFDKIVAWGGDAAVRNAAKYLGPGLELIAFDPKNSISMIGREVFASEDTLAAAAALAASDSAMMNQEACTAPRFHFVEGDAQDVDRYCALLLQELRQERALTSARVNPPPAGLLAEIEALATIGGPYRVFGNGDGTGLVVRSDEPVDFFPSNKTVNVVCMSSLLDAIAYVNVSTQTVCMFPDARKVELRDALASAGVQRVVPLGKSAPMIGGFPHDGFYPMQRLVRWVNDES